MHLRGFLLVPRSALAVSAAIVAFTFVPIQDLPASAAAVVEETAATTDAPVMKVGLTVPTTVSEDYQSRDAYGVEVHTLVSWPLDPNTKISSPFGHRSSPCRGCSSDHEGVDFDPGAGAPIAAIADGVVVEIGNPSGPLGVHAIIEHVIDGVRVRSMYGHMAIGSMGLKVGDAVQRGELIGLVGSTGASTGAHLHFGIILDDDEMVDPLPWLKAHANA